MASNKFSEAIVFNFAPNCFYICFVFIFASNPILMTADVTSKKYIPKEKRFATQYAPKSRSKINQISENAISDVQFEEVFQYLKLHKNLMLTSFSQEERQAKKQIPCKRQAKQNTNCIQSAFLYDAPQPFTL